ncbi:MAG TPA: DNA polymerase III subunit gamma/tau, partial [Bacilli bacterium]|nr:DNA polymerase III subunit gamma/tau [Bacilli bacterium]
MNYKVLYRKYRPNNFDELIGQEHIIKILKNSIIENKIAHAYLFTGPRGTGKTSTAKLFAKALNCTNSTNGIPCEKCDNCKNFNNNPDIIELDAASNNGVDNMRLIIDGVQVAPAMSKYKIYIIDEAHMLSSSAWNAFLKTLEEPPENVIFILATTEIQKVPLTILSRCQRFDFCRINKDEITKHLEKICEKENIKYEEDAIKEISNISDGCMRDALSVLDQLSKAADVVTVDILKQNYGTVTDYDIDII